MLDYEGTKRNKNLDGEGRLRHACSSEFTTYYNTGLIITEVFQP